MKVELTTTDLLALKILILDEKDKAEKMLSMYSYGEPLYKSYFEKYQHCINLLAKLNAAK